MEVTSSPELSVEEPQSVPSRILVVLIEEAKVRGTKCLGCPRVDQDLRLLAGVANPACATVCEDRYISPCVGGTLSPSDSEPVGPVGLYGTLSPSATVAVGPVGPYGTLSTSDSDDPVGPYGTLSPSAGPRPYGTLSPLSLTLLALLARVGRCPRLILLQYALWALVGRCPHPIRPVYCFRPCLLGYCSQ